MKNEIVLGLTMATLSLFASCSSDETVEVPTGRAIQFTENFVDNSTRTIINQTSEFTNFQVYGWVSNGTENGLLFNGETVSNTTGTWSYTNTQYWIEGATYMFSAIGGFSASDGTLSINSDNNTRVSTPSIAGYSSNGQNDLIYANSAKTSYTGLKSNNETVGFTFEHQLARVKFSFKNGLGANAALDVHVKEIKITNPIESGDVLLSGTKGGATWFSQARAAAGVTPKALDFGSAPSTTASSAISTTAFSACSQENLVIPATNQDYTVTFTTDLYQGGIKVKSVDHTATITGMTFVAGTAYNFTAELNADNLLGKDGDGNDTKLEPIEFTATATDWTTADGQALANYPKTDN